MEGAHAHGVDHYEVVRISDRYQLRVEYRERDGRGLIGIRLWACHDGAWSPRKSGVHVHHDALPDLISALRAMHRQLEDSRDD